MRCDAAKARPAAFVRRRRPCTPGVLAATLLVACALLSVGPAAEAASTITASGGTASYTERATAGTTAVDAALTVTTDNIISSATVRITYATGNEVDANDLLTVATSNGLSQGSGFDASTDTLTITGSGTAATYQTVLRTVSFYNPSSTPSNEQRTITFTVNDADGSSSSSVKYLDVVQVDDGPSVSFSLFTTSYSEQQGALVIDSGISIVDLDSTEITKAVVSITSGYDSGKDVLSTGSVDVTQYKAQDGITSLGMTSTFDAGTGTLTVSGSAPIATYDEILRAVDFRNDDDDPSGSDREVSFKVSDATSSSSDGIFITISFTVADDDPVLASTKSSDAVTWTEGDGALTLDNTITITDVDDANMVSATVKFDSGYDGAQGDVLQYAGNGALPGNLQASWDADLGKLVISSTTTSETKANFQAALRGIEYVNTNEKPTAGARTVSFITCDEAPLTSRCSNYVYASFTVVAVNDPPVVSGSTADKEYSGKTVTLQDAVTLTDVDHDNLASIEIEVTSGCDETESLTFTSTGGVVGSGDATTGCKLTLSGAATVASYQTTLRSVQMTVGASTNYARTVTIKVTDGTDYAATTLSRDYFALDNLPNPTISSTSRPGTAGGTVTITGTNFGPVSPNLITKVQIGQAECTSATVTVANTELTCTVAAGTGAGITVVVTAGVDKKSDVVSPYAIFSYQNPTVTATTRSPTAGGTITITGTNFGPTGNTALSSASGGSVIVAGKTCTSATVTTAHTTLTCEQPEGTGASGNIVVTVDTLDSGTSGNGLHSYAVPSVTSVAQGSFLGYTTTFTGTNFGPVGTSLTVSVQRTGGNAFTCTSATVTVAHTTFTCTIPAASLSTGANTADLSLTYDVSVTCDSVAGTSADKFQYEGPVITSIGTISYNGAEVTITGRNFGPANQVVTQVNIGSGGFYVGTTEGTGTNDTPSGSCTPKTTTEHTTICAYFKDYKTTGTNMSPAVTVKISGQTSASFTGFTYEGPVVTGTSTGSQFGGGPTSTSSITITGRNFGAARTFKTSDATYGTETLSIGGTQVTTGTLTVVSDTEITSTQSAATATSPLTTQDADISLTLFDQTSTGGTGKFSYVGPTVTSVTGVDTSGNTITITGENFGPVKATKDYFDTSTYSSAGVTLCINKSCTSTISCTNPQVTVADTKITCAVAAGYVPVNAKITVKMNDGTLDSGTTGDGKLSINAPTVTAIAPTDGPATSGGTLTVTGTNFGPAGNSYASVKTGSNTCSSVTVKSHTELTW